MSEDTIVMTAPRIRAPQPLVPVLAVVALAATLAAGIFFQRAGERADALAAATNRAAQSDAELGRARQRVRELEQQLATQQTALASVLKTTLPIDVSFHVGEPGLGYAARFENRSTDEMKITVEPRRPRSGEYGKLELTVPAQGSGEIGDKQGWAFRSGDTLTVSYGDFRPISLVVP